MVPLQGESNCLPAVLVDDGKILMNKDVEGFDISTEDGDIKCCSS